MLLAITPALQDDVSLWAVILTALLNPAVIVVAWAMGRRADQMAKLVIAAFAAALAGLILVWLATLFRVPGAATISRAAAGVFVADFLFGLGWAYAGWRTRARP